MTLRQLRQTLLTTTTLLAAAAPVFSGEFAGFEPPALYPVDFLPWSIRAGDLDGDGDVDLITANNAVTSSNLSLLFNHGDGTFAPVVNIPVGSDTRDVAIADLDGDGIVDLAVAFGGNSPLGGGPIGGLALLKGLGGGEFAEPQYFNAGVQPVSIDAGDFNGDGAPDLILANQLSNNVAVFFNNGDGAIQPPVFYPVGNRPQQGVIADMDADGDLDAAIINAFSRDISVLLNDGKGVFLKLDPVETSNGGNTRIRAADIDLDGLPDIIVPKASAGVFAIHFNLADGALSEPILISPAPPPSDVARVDVADFTIDGLPDVAVGTITPFTTTANALERMCRNEGNGQLIPLHVGFPLGGPIGVRPSAQCAADFDKNGSADIATAFANEVSVLLNKTKPQEFDLTGDGFVNTPDLVLLLNTWGKPGAADFDKSGAVDGRDLAHLLTNWTPPAHGAPASDASSAPPDWKLIRSTHHDINGDGVPDRLDLRAAEASGHKRTKFDVHLSGDRGELRHVSALDPLDLRGPTKWTLIRADHDQQLDLVIFDPEAQSLFVFLGSEKYGFDSQHVVIPFAPGARTLMMTAAHLRSLATEDQTWLTRLIAEEETP